MDLCVCCKHQHTVHSWKKIDESCGCESWGTCVFIEHLITDVSNYLDTFANYFWPLLYQNLLNCFALTILTAREYKAWRQAPYRVLHAYIQYHHVRVWECYMLLEIKVFTVSLGLRILCSQIWDSIFYALKYANCASNMFPIIQVYTTEHKTDELLSMQKYYI